MTISLMPYFVGVPVATAVFCGRQDDITWLLSELKNVSAHALLLHGPRAIGKTSLLHYLQTRLAADGYRPVYYELAERPLNELLDDLAQQILAQVDLDLPLPDSSNAFRSQFLPEVQQALGSPRLVLLLDNIDKVPGDHGFWKIVPILTGDSPPVLLFASTLGPSQLTQKLKSVVKALPARALAPLADEAAGALLNQGAERLDFTEEAIARIVAWSGGHPHLLQVMGRALWETAAERIVVEMPLVEEMVVRLIEGDTAHFDVLWDSLDVAEMLYTAVLAQLHQPFEFMATPMVSAAVKEQAFRLRPHKVDWSVKDLLEHHVLHRAGSGKYSLMPPLFHAWVRRHKPVTVVKEYLDHMLNPEADEWFQEGRDYFHEAQYEEAISCFREVIGKTPYHVGAQLALGESLLATGSVETAVKQLEKAHKLDAAEATPRLANALVIMAETQWEAEARNEALTACEQFNKVGSDNPDWQRRIKVVETAVWNQRGDMALQRDLTDRAITAYENAGNTEMVAQLKGNPKQTKPKSSHKPSEPTDQLEAKAKTLLQAEIWSEAAAIYEKLLSRAQDAQRRSNYQKALAQCLEEIELGQHFDEGVKALDNQNWLLARMSFTHVVTRRKDYTRYDESALALLDQAVKGRPPTAPLASSSSNAYVAPETSPLTPNLLYPEASEAKPHNLREPEAKPDVEPVQQQIENDATTISPADPAIVEAANEFEQLKLLGKGAIKQVAYSPDGKLLALATALGVYLYQTQPLTEIRFIESAAPIQSVAFSPDNSMFATGSWQHKVQLWLVESEQPIAEFRSHDSTVMAIAFSPDGNTLASADENGVIITWQLDSKQFLRSWEAHRGPITSLVFSPDGHNLLSGSEDKHFCLWQVDNEMSLSYLQKHTKGVIKVAFSPDGKRFFSVSRDGTVNAWQINMTGWLRLRRHSAKVNMIYSRPGQYHELNDLDFSPDGKLVATASADSIVRLWDAEKGELLHEFKGHVSPVISVAFSPDGQTLMSATESFVQSWSVANRAASQAIEDHMGPLQSLAVSKDGQLVATADHTRIFVWSLADLTLRHVLSGHTGLIYRLAFSSQNNLLASASTDHTVRLWDTEGGLTIQILEHEQAVIDVCFTPNGQQVATASEAQTILLWQVEDGKQLQSLSGHRDVATTVCFNSTGQILASGSSDQTINLWDVTEEHLQRTLTGHKGIVWQVAFSADDALVASAALDHTVRLWQVENGVLWRVLGKHGGPVWSVHFSPDGQMLATGAGDHKVRLWCPANGLLLRTLAGHTASVSSVAFTSDEGKLISASADGTVRVWGIAQ